MRFSYVARCVRVWGGCRGTSARISLNTLNEVSFGGAAEASPRAATATLVATRPDSAESQGVNHHPWLGIEGADETRQPVVCPMLGIPIARRIFRRIHFVRRIHPAKLATLEEV